MAYGLYLNETTREVCKLTYNNKKGLDLIHQSVADSDLI